MKNIKGFTKKRYPKTSLSITGKKRHAKYSIQSALTQNLYKENTEVDMDLPLLRLL